MRGSDGRNGKDKHPLWVFLPFCPELPRKQTQTNQINAALLSSAGLPPPGSLNNPMAAKRHIQKGLVLRLRFGFVWWSFTASLFAVGVVKASGVLGIYPGREFLQKIKAICKTQPPFFVACLFIVCAQTAHGTRQAVKDCFCKLPHEPHGKRNKPTY